MALPTFPPPDRSRYLWRASQDDPLFYQREAHGGEYLDEVFHRLKNGDQILSIGLQLDLSIPIAVDDLVHHAREAWSTLRFSLPSVALHTGLDDSGNTIMKYRAARDAAEVRDWATRTVCLQEGVQSLDALRHTLSKVLLPKPNGDLTFLHVFAMGGTSYGLLLHTSHVPFDGAGGKIMLTLFLDELVKHLTGAPDARLEDLEWGTEGKNLLPAMCHILGPEEIPDGPVYDQNLGEVITEFATLDPLQHSCRPREYKPGAATGRVQHTFSAEESARIFRSAREAGFTINQIAHVACALVCYADNPATPSTPDNATMSFLGIVDCRPRLASPYSDHLGYPAYALTISAIAFPIPTLTAIHQNLTKPKFTELVSETRQQYLKQKAYPSLAAILGQVIDIIMAPLHGATGPPPPSMAAWFAGDGVCERFLHTSYADRGGKPIIKVSDYILSDNKVEPGPFFRAWTFDGRLSLSIDYNDASVTRREMDGMISKWAEYTRLFL